MSGGEQDRIVWLDVAEVVALHEAIMRRLGESPEPLRDADALEAAIMRPRMAAHYAGGDLCDFAARLAVGISQAQAFLDGNKRTAYAALEVFLYVNGVRLKVEGLTVAQRLEAIATANDREAATVALAAWLRSRGEPISE